ncbi:MAG TPA: PTS sugar transporter subunit IIA [Candidatus Eisenbacteria bacterium]
MGIAIVPSVPQPALCIPELGPRKRDAALQLMLATACEAGALRDADSVLEALVLRERLGTTAIGKGVAVPNARALGVLEPHCVLARSERGIEWSAPDGLPVQLVLLVLSPPESAVSAHLDWLARAMSTTRLARSRARLLEARDAAGMAALVRQVLA